MTHALDATLTKMNADNDAAELAGIKSRQAAIMNAIRAEETSTSALQSVQNRLKGRARGLLDTSKALRMDLVAYKESNATGNSKDMVASVASATDTASQMLEQQYRALATQERAINIQIERNKMSVKALYNEHTKLSARRHGTTTARRSETRAEPSSTFATPSLATKSLAADIRSTFSGK